ncbi:M23 family metallopeptidase [Pelotomaculum propionicicum]|uniref:M23 family metallopeptidase n=1 Tax=Pelotomaculum propionicicum TaxID=258475 RepID=UPI003B797E56
MNENDLMEKFKRLGAALAKKGGKYLLKILAPYLPVIGFVLFVILLIVGLIGAVYSALPNTEGSNRQVGILADANISSQDEEMYKEYKELVNKYNVEDTWVVNELANTPGCDGCEESSLVSPFYPGTGVVNLNRFADRYGSDQKLKLLWSQVHAADLYRAYSLGEVKIEPKVMDKTAKDLHPYYYYKKSVVVACGKEGCETSEVYLLVEAYTIEGHFQYHYQWTTKYGNEGESTTFEELVSTKQILPNKWQRLEDWMVKEYKVTDNVEDIALARTGVWEAAQGFYNKKEWMDWLSSSGGYTYSWISGAMVPAELVPFFEKAADKYGIPVWFLEAIALMESSFNVTAENTTTGCYGLMQVSPDNWKKYAPELGYDVVADKDNPEAQIMVGAFMLYEQGLKGVDWDSPKWKEQTLDVLTFYGGFRGKGAKEECRDKYASVIWAYADQFKNAKVGWPAPTCTEISSPFGWRSHPITGEYKFHEGIDIPADCGEPVVSISGGMAYTGNSSGSGNYVVVKDGTYEYWYLHLSEQTVVSGQQVVPGQEVGKVGDTGASKGCHLHFSVYPLDSSEAIDPLLILGR